MHAVRTVLADAMLPLHGTSQMCLWAPKGVMPGLGQTLMVESQWTILGGTLAYGALRPPYSPPAIIKGKSTLGHQGVFGAPRHPETRSLPLLQN